MKGNTVKEQFHPLALPDSLNTERGTLRFYGTAVAVKQLRLACRPRGKLTSAASTSTTTTNSKLGREIKRIMVPEMLPVWLERVGLQIRR